jgi:YVTN family beta-propeller protein
MLPRNYPKNLHFPAPARGWAAALPGSATGRLSRAILCCAGLFAASAAAQAPPIGVAYVSNQQGGVSVIDLSRMEIARTLDTTGKGPRGIGLSDDGKLLVTANLGDGDISVVDTASGQLLRRVPIGKNPEFVRVLGNTAYVTFEPQGGAPPAGAMAQSPSPAPAGANADADDRIPGHIAVVDLLAGKVVLDIVGKPETEGIAFSPRHDRMIVTNESDNSLSIIDVASGKLVKAVPVGPFGNRPRGIKGSPDGKTYVTTLELGNKMLVLDDDFNVVREVPTGAAPYGVAFNGDGSRVYVAANKAKLLQVFDAKTWEKLADVPTGERCWHFSFTPDGRQILLACGRSNEVIVIDVQSLAVAKHIDKLHAPWGIVTFPRSPGSID